MNGNNHTNRYFNLDPRPHPDITLMPDDVAPDYSAIKSSGIEVACLPCKGTGYARVSRPGVICHGCGGSGLDIIPMVSTHEDPPKNTQKGDVI